MPPCRRTVDRRPSPRSRELPPPERRRTPARPEGRLLTLELGRAARRGEILERARRRGEASALGLRALLGSGLLGRFRRRLLVLDELGLCGLRRRRSPHLVCLTVCRVRDF